jgi:hypothetical protein
MTSILPTSPAITGRVLVVVVVLVLVLVLVLAIMLFSFGLGLSAGGPWPRAAQSTHQAQARSGRATLMTSVAETDCETIDPPARRSGWPSRSPHPTLAEPADLTQAARDNCEAEGEAIQGGSLGRGRGLLVCAAQPERAALD